MSDLDVTFPAMGCDVRLIVGGAGAQAAVDDARAFLADVDGRLSRFRAGSELCALNADPRDEVPASALLRAAVRAGVWAARRTGGLVTPVVVDALEAAGYDRSLAGAQPASVADALAWAPPRRAAAPDPAAPWRAVAVDDRASVVRRPPGLRLDTGGTGKGLAADALAHRLRGRERAVVDCGGDIRVVGPAAAARPLRVEVAHPLRRRSAHVLQVTSGAVATSGIDVRLWRDRDGGYAHHLLDPSSGRPAWTGLVAVTALAPTALEAETLSKSALLSGPAGARRLLRACGGVLVHDDGDVEALGPARARGRVRVRLPEAA